ncbi:hypothetical protein QQF64_023547 [Cirrhinus molitorella]|uniref:PiggyBac transposable element-derived protein domain-containing protein n=1 Tax=Cirrhinus molitorella TaxID=172907 RepID=A0ABR3NIY8_9TELE
MGVEPISSVYRYCSDTKRKEPVNCPAVIKSYNANMGGIDKSDMLVHLYRTPMKSKRWYMRMFAYAIDLCLTNAWIMYRRDIKALSVDGLSLKNFRIQVFRSCSSQSPAMSRPRRSSSFSSSPSTSADVPKLVRGHRVEEGGNHNNRSPTPDDSVWFDMSLFHARLHHPTDLQVLQQEGEHIEVKRGLVQKGARSHKNSVEKSPPLPGQTGNEVHLSDPAVADIRKHRRLTDVEGGKVSAAGREREATKSLIGRQTGSQASVGHARNKRQSREQ